MFFFLAQLNIYMRITMNPSVTSLVKHTMRHGKVSPSEDEWSHSHYSQHLVIDVGSYVGALYRLKNDNSRKNHHVSFLNALDTEVRFMIPQINAITIDCSKMTQQVVSHDKTVAINDLFNTFLHAIMNNYNKEHYNTGYYPIHAVHLIITDCVVSLLWQAIYSCMHQTGYQCERLTLVRCKQVELSLVARLTFAGLCLRDCHFVFSNRCDTPMMLDRVDMELEKFNFDQWYKMMANNMVHAIMDNAMEMDTVINTKRLEIHCPADTIVPKTELSLVLFNMGISFKSIISFHIDVSMIALPDRVNKAPIVATIANDFNETLLRAKSLGIVSSTQNLSAIEACESLVDLELLPDTNADISNVKASLPARVCKSLESLEAPIFVLTSSLFRFHNLKYVQIDCRESAANDDIIGKILMHCLGLTKLSLRNACNLNYDFVDDDVTIFSPKLTSLDIDCHPECMIEPLRMLDKFELHELGLTFNNDNSREFLAKDISDKRYTVEYVISSIGECGRGNMNKISVNVNSSSLTNEARKAHLEWRDLIKFQIIHALYERYGCCDRGVDENGESTFTVNFDDVSKILCKRNDPQIQLWTHLLYHFKKSSSEHRLFGVRNGANSTIIVKTNLPPIADLSLKIATSRFNSAASGSGTDLSLLLEKSRTVSCDCAHNEDDETDVNVWPSTIFDLLHRVVN
ncbi:U19-like protein [Lissonota sp. PSUC_FEM 10030012]|nr:U19-like protein [Lissonota sp. PSUC_FEM 10030012]